MYEGRVVESDVSGCHLNCDVYVMRRIPFSFLFLVSVLLSCAAFPLLAQSGTNHADVTDLYSYGDDYFFEVVTMPEWGGNKSRVAVLVRLSYNLLSFRKISVPGSTDDLFVSTPSVYVEAQASDGVIVDYGRWTDTVQEREYRLTNSRQYFAPGVIELRLRPGTYTISYTIEDGSSSEPFSRTTEEFRVPDFSGGKPEIGTPIFLREMNGDAAVAAAIDGNAHFGQPLRAWIPLASENPPSNLRYEVLAVETDGEEKRESFSFRTIEAGTAELRGSAVPGTMLSQGNNIVFAIERDSVPRGVYGAYLEYGAGSLEEGDYALLLEYQAGGETVADTVLFSLRWIEKPFTLVNPTYAINALYPIATDEEIDELLSVDKERREDALTVFWKNQDPTPETVYNERMAEFYRRADYAYFNFASLSEQDGVFTDRGKIYMLFGPPTKTERELKPDTNPEEIWTYNNIVSREFIFRDRTESGAYQLVEYYDL